MTGMRSQAEDGRPRMGGDFAERARVSCGCLLAGQECRWLALPHACLDFLC